MPKPNIQQNVPGGSGAGDLKATEKSNDGWWAPIWSGLTTDPQHQERMGSAIWVYLYLQTYADRETGQLFRNCEKISEEMGRSVKTIRRQIEKLEGQGYLVLTRKSHGFSIQITKWKPIKKIKRLDIVDQSDGGEKPSPRVPKSDQSQTERVDTSDQSQPEVSGHSCPGDWTVLSQRVDTFVQSPIRKYKESIKKRLKKVVAGETVSVESEVCRFLNFAGKTHSTIRHSNLFFDGEPDKSKATEMLEQFPFKTLCVAWVLFLHSDDTYIVEHYPSRNIAVFKAQLRNFIEPAERKLAGIKARQVLRARSREPTAALDPLQAEKWKQCLYEIESQILPDNFKTWFTLVTFGGIENGKAKIICPDKNHVKVISENYLDLIEGIMAMVFGKKVKPGVLLETG